MTTEAVPEDNAEDVRITRMDLQMYGAGAMGDVIDPALVRRELSSFYGQLDGSRGLVALNRVKSSIDRLSEACRRPGSASKAVIRTMWALVAIPSDQIQCPEKNSGPVQQRGLS